MKPGVKAFVVYDKRLLFILRDNNPNISFPNTWSLPGGGIEDGESETEAISRELKEEICIVPKGIVFLGKQIYKDGSEVYRYLVYLKREEYEDLKLGDEGQKLDFFSIEEVNNIKLSGYLNEYFLQYKDQIKLMVEEGKMPNAKSLGLTI